MGQRRDNESVSNHWLYPVTREIKHEVDLLDLIDPKRLLATGKTAEPKLVWHDDNTKPCQPYLDKNRAKQNGQPAEKLTRFAR